MQIAIRPFLLAGIAFSGAAAVALTPITPNLPDIQMPAITTPALELAALPSYLEWVQAGTEAETKNIPSWQQILDPNFSGALSTAAELGSYLFRQFLPATSIFNGSDSVPASTPPQTPQEFINTVEAILDNPSFIPTIMNDLVQVVQNVATNTVEPVLNLVLRITFSTLYRASNIMKATFQDVPAIATTVLAAGGGILQSLSDGVVAVITAAMADPFSILGALTDGVMNVGAVLMDQTIKVIDAVDKYRQDLESALLTAPPQSAPSPADNLAAAAVAAPDVASRLAPVDSTPLSGAGDSSASDSTTGSGLNGSDLGSSKLDDANKLDGVSQKLGGTTNPNPTAGDADITPPSNTNPARSAGLAQSGRPASKPSATDKADDSSSGGKTGTKAGSKPRSANR